MNIPYLTPLNKLEQAAGKEEKKTTHSSPSSALQNALFPSLHPKKSDLIEHRLKSFMSAMQKHLLSKTTLGQIK